MNNDDLKDLTGNILASVEFNSSKASRVHEEEGDGVVTRGELHGSKYELEEEWDYQSDINDDVDYDTVTANYDADAASDDTVTADDSDAASDVVDDDTMTTENMDAANVAYSACEAALAAYADASAYATAVAVDAVVDQENETQRYNRRFQLLVDMGFEERTVKLAIQQYHSTLEALKWCKEYPDHKTDLKDLKHSLELSIPFHVSLHHELCQHPQITDSKQLYEFAYRLRRFMMDPNKSLHAKQKTITLGEPADCYKNLDDIHKVLQHNQDVAQADRNDKESAAQKRADTLKRMFEEIQATQQTQYNNLLTTMEAAQKRDEMLKRMLEKKPQGRKIQALKDIYQETLENHEKHIDELKNYMLVCGVLTGGFAIIVGTPFLINQYSIRDNCLKKILQSIHRALQDDAE